MRTFKLFFIFLFALQANLFGQLSGTKTIDPGGSGGNNYTSFTLAINALNSSGVGSGGVVFNVKDGAIFTENPPVITASGTVSNTIVFQRDNSTSTRPVIKPTGGAGSTDAGIGIQGGDYITFDGIDIAINTGSALEYGYRIYNATATNGANYITIKNCKITLNRESTAAYGIRQHANTAPSSSAGANSNNKYQNITVENAYRGFSIDGNSTYREFNLEISNCTIGAETADDIGGNLTQTYGIYATNVDAVTITDNTVRNVTCTGGSTMAGIYFPGTTSGTSEISRNTVYNIKGSSTAYGIYTVSTGPTTVSNNIVYSVSATSDNVNAGIQAQIGSGGGTNNNVFNNLIKSLTSPGRITGLNIQADHSSVTVNVYNNMVADLVSASTATTFNANQGPQVKAININNSSTNLGTVNVYYNSVSFQDDATPPNTCFHMRYGTVVSKNNIFANFSSSGASAAMYCVYKNQTGGTLTSDYNDLYTTSGASKYIGFDNATTYATFAAWQGLDFDANSVSLDPQFVSSTDLHINPNVSSVDGLGTPISGITTDFDGDTRNASTPDPGADEYTVMSTQGITISLKAFLEGPFEATEMTTDLYTLGIIPINQPYNTTPWNYEGDENVTVLPNTDIVDWILVELRETFGDASTAIPSTSIARRAGFLLQDGTIVDLDGTAPLGFDVEVTQNLFAVLYHRNHFGIMSSVPLISSGNDYTYDFTTNGSSVYGGSYGYKELVPGIWGMMAGNGNADSKIDNIDKNDLWYDQFGNNGYFQGDFDMNGTINADDKINKWDSNAGHNSFVPE